MEGSNVMSTYMNNAATGTVDNHAERFGGMFLFLGIALIVLGSIAVLSSVFVTMGAVMFVGGLLMAGGIAELIHAFRARKSENILWNILSSLVYLISGVLLLFNPIIGALSLTIVVAAYLLAMGVIRIWYSIKHRKEKGWGWFLFDGILNLALGGIIAYGWPFTGLWVIGLFVGIEMITHGIAWLVLGGAVEEQLKAPTAGSPA
jgi:uncharacterized membrane protein HdeD (DUF308 family)